MSICFSNCGPYNKLLTANWPIKNSLAIMANTNRLLTQIKMCCRPVAVQFGVKIFILAVHFNSFSVEVNGAAEILLVVFIVTVVLVNLCHCYNEVNEKNLHVGITDFRLSENCVIMAFQCSKFSLCFHHKSFIKLCNCCNVLNNNKKFNFTKVWNGKIRQRNVFPLRFHW